MRTALTIWALALVTVTSGQTGSINANAPIPASPEVYTVVAVPANWRSDAKATALVNAFATDPTLRELKSKSQVDAYTADDPDWQHRWAAKVPKLPAVVIVKSDGTVLYK